MLSVRLPQPLENQLSAFCESQQLSKSSVVQMALEKHLKLVTKPTRKAPEVNPFEALCGIGNRKFTTDQIMRMTRGDDWNKQ